MSPAKQLLQLNCLPRAHFRRMGSHYVPKKTSIRTFPLFFLPCSLQMKTAASTNAENPTKEVPPNKDLT